MRYLLKCASFVDSEYESNGRLRTADILVEGDTIRRIADHIEDAPAGETINAERYLVTPGLVNAHGHLAMTLLRGLADGVPLQSWLEDYMFPRERLLTGDDVYVGTQLCLAEGILSGTTTFADMYFFEDDVARAIEEAGVKANLSTGTASLGDEAGKLQRAEDFVVRCNNTASGRIKASFGPHAPYTTTPEFIGAMFTRAQQLGVVVQFHLHETRGEVAAYVEKYGCSPIACYAERGYFDTPPHLVAAHCVHMAQRDIEILERAGASIALNVQSNLKLGSGVADYRSLLASGINLAVGTDGAASNDNVDMLEEVRVLGFMMKGSTMEPAEVSNNRLLSMATLGGARALGFDDTGVIREGAKADLVFWDTDDVSFCPHNDVVSHLLWSANSRAVDAVMVDGQFVLRHHELLTIDIDRVRFEAVQRAHRLAAL